MAFFSFMKRRPRADDASKSGPPSSAPVPTGEADDAVAAARARARRRLIGATVLLVVGIVGFPIIFETQPRPIAIDIPIEITRKDGLPPLSLPARPAPESPPVAASAPPAEAGPTSEGPAAATAVPALPPPVAASTPAVRPQSLATPAASIPATAAPAAVASAVRPPPHASSDDDGARARALLEGLAGSAVANAASEAASEATAPRYVVQFGAFADDNAARDARAKVEKLGLKTYAQVIGSSAGKRTRVRVGPFANRVDADKAAARIEAAGMTANVLTL
jgi:DedD protein